MVTTYAYDLMGRKTEEVVDSASLAIKTTWLYDQWDGGESVFYDVIQAWEDAENHQDTEYYYGADEHPSAVTKTTYPDSGDVTVTYNDDGTVATRTDQRGWTVAYTYDDALRRARGGAHPAARAGAHALPGRRRGSPQGPYSRSSGGYLTEQP
jgi:YD repeat-containing protein